jgi:hypothetical protein
MHAPHSMLNHWDMIQPKDDMDDNEMDSMSLCFTSSESLYNQKIFYRNLELHEW